MDGMLSRDGFRSSCLYTIDAWSTHCPVAPPWAWRDSPVSAFTGEGYLVIEDVLFQHPYESNFLQITAGYDKEIDIYSDIATVQPQSCQDLFYTYHIVYNEMYRVPKLFLKGRYPDGLSLQLKDVQNMLPVGLSNESTKWTFLTYEEHPYLHMPWLALHPCGTSELMHMVFSTSNGSVAVTSAHAINLYILTWLSFVSQAVGWKLSPEFSRCFTREAHDQNSRAQ